MGENMKISIAMTTYNGMKHIREQLDSLRNQTRHADEVIIIDDNSSDDTYSFIREYVQKYSLDSWLINRNEENCGYIKNFKLALSLCSGDIIFTCDQDDVWREDKISKMAEIMENDTSIQLLSAGTCFIDSEGNRINRQYIPYHMKNCEDGCSVRIAFSQILEKNFFPGCTMAIRSNIVQIFCKSGDTGISHDWVLGLLAAAKNGLVWYNEPLTFYRLHENNTLGLAAVAKAKIQYIPYMIVQWENYCSEFEKRVDYTERNIILNDYDLVYFGYVREFSEIRNKIVLGDSTGNKVNKVRLYLREIKCYIKCLRGFIDKKGLIIDCIYIFKKRKHQ